MGTTRIVQVGLGPLGQKIAKYILERNGVEITGAVDKDPEKVGKDLGELCGVGNLGIKISDSFTSTAQKAKPDIALLTTVSDMERVTPQIEEILSQAVPVVSTCEELSYPWEAAPELSKKIDQLAKSKNVAVLGTGVNPGFLMDSFPTALTAICQRVDSIKVSRIQNAQFRRVPFQKKIGAGLSLEEFDKKKAEGTLRHVGLAESVYLIANRMGWKLDKVEDILTPVIAESEIKTDVMTIPKGYASGVQQIGKGHLSGEEKITMIFKASVGEPHPEDTVEIKGEPNIVSTIPGGVNGDVATCAITINAVRQALRATPGLKTMVDVPVVSYFGE